MTGDASDGNLRWLRVFLNLLRLRIRINLLSSHRWISKNHWNKRTWRGDL